MVLSSFKTTCTHWQTNYFNEVLLETDDVLHEKKVIAKIKTMFKIFDFIS